MLSFYEFFMTLWRNMIRYCRVFQPAASRLAALQQDSLTFKLKKTDFDDWNERKVDICTKIKHLKAHGEILKMLTGNNKFRSSAMDIIDYPTFVAASLKPVN